MLVWIAKNMSIPVMRALGELFGNVRFSVGEAVLLALIAYAATGIAAVLIFHGDRARVRRLAATLARSAAIIALSYVLVWFPIAGYYRLGVSGDEPGADEIYELCKTLGRDAYEQYQYYDPDAGDVTKRVAQAVFNATGMRPVIKTSMWPKWMGELNLAGVCLPWSGEALVRMDMPKVALPFVMAHESCHQIGIGPESEANYVAYEALKTDPTLSYSATVYAFYYAMGALKEHSPAGYSLIASSMDERVMRDYARVRSFSSGDSGAMSPVAEAFLRFGGQSGLDGYGRMVYYIINGTTVMKE